MAEATRKTASAPTAAQLAIHPAGTNRVAVAKAPSIFCDDGARPEPDHPERDGFNRRRARGGSGIP